MQPNTEESTLKDYYSRRVGEYEQIYQRDDPVRQAEQTAIAKVLRQMMPGRRVLEVACGTAFWTKAFADAAKHVVATDASPEMLAAARSKGLHPDKVEFHIADAYALDIIPGTFDAGVANFWLSHVPIKRIQEFLAGFHARLGSGASVFMADNVCVPGLGGELIQPPGSQDTYKVRTIANGSQHRIIKNYYDANQLHTLFGPYSDHLQIHVGECFWWISYTITQ